MSVPDKIIDKELYKQIRKEYFKINKKNSAYRSLQLIKLYKEAGGRINTKLEKKSGLTQWLKEEWIEVVPYILFGEKIKCGDQNSPFIACRPFQRINEKTPITINELIEIYGAENVLNFAMKKEENKKKRANWEKLMFY